MRLVLNTNILISALIKDSVIRKVLLLPFFEWLLPEYALEEINSHINIISDKSNLGKEEIDLVLRILLDNVTIVSKHEMKDFLSKADKKIGYVDKKDIPFVALAYAISNDGIWTEDRHFEILKDIKIWKTKDIIRYLGW